MQDSVCNCGGLLAVAVFEVVGPARVYGFPRVIGKPPVFDAPLHMLHPVPSDAEIQPVREVFLGMGEEIRAGGESLNEGVPNKTILP